MHVVLNDVLFLHFFNKQDEEKKAVSPLNWWRKFLAYFRKMNAYHDLVADSEATFSNANANGNPSEQCVKKFVCVDLAFVKNNIAFMSFRFIVKDRCTSYSSAQRSLMVMQVLLRTKYDESEKVSKIKCKFTVISNVRTIYFHLSRLEYGDCLPMAHFWAASHYTKDITKGRIHPALYTIEE